MKKGMIGERNVTLPNCGWRIFLCGVGCNSAVILSGSSAVEASWEASDFFGSCVAPLRLGGLRGKKSTPSVWLGGTGENSAVGKSERQGARDFDRGADINQGRLKGKGMLLIC